MKKLRILILALVVGLIVYIPVQFLLIPAKAAENPEKTQEILPLPDELQYYDSGLTPTQFTTPNYIPPQFDPFNNKYRPYHGFEDEIPVGDRGSNTSPEAGFNIRTKENGLADTNSGTTKTNFIFDAYASTDSETKSNRLEVRWDFESDGKLDSYFTRTKSVEHQYEKAGTYNVTLEVRDEGGLISHITKSVAVVENTAPFAYFSYTPGTGTTNKIFTFNTLKSDDSQYRHQYLEYRFDWNGDGQWDTVYQKKTSWRHVFDTSGTQHVIMEVKDPEGLTTTADAYIPVTDNIAPHAEFTVDVKETKVGVDQVRNRYYFDASGSSDTEDEKLLYRWDFNYTGSNDISFETSFSSSPRYSGFYDFPGEKVVRLQVKDPDGAVTDAFMTIVAE